MKKLIVGGLAALAIGLIGCSCTAASVDAPSSTPIVAPPVLPVSTLAPGITLPAGSVNTVFEKYRDTDESWESHATSFDATVSHLNRQLPPSGQDFNGLKWCSKTVVSKPGYFGYPPDEEVTWMWGDNITRLRIHVEHGDSEDHKDINVINVIITRDDADRSDCDAEKDEGYLTALAGMIPFQNLADPRAAVEARRKEFIEAGQKACSHHRETDDGEISTSVWVMDNLGFNADEAGSIAVAALEVYCS